MGAPPVVAQHIKIPASPPWPFSFTVGAAAQSAFAFAFPFFDTSDIVVAKAGVSPTTVNLLEADRPYRNETAAKIVAAFARKGVEIINGDGTGARLFYAERSDSAD